MPLFDSSKVPADAQEREWWYNSLDSAVTLEISNTFAKQYGEGENSSAWPIYSFERAMQGPALDMMLRGFRIDPVWRQRYISQLAKQEARLEEILNKLAYPIWGKPLNPRSPQQLCEFFYNQLNLPEVWIRDKGVSKLSTNREALEKLSDYYIGSPFVSTILAARDVRKKLGTLRSGVDPDGRMRCTYNVCGTETGRWASSENVFGRGTNLQNITDELRRMFVADPGMILLYIDGEQAESRAVGFIEGVRFNDWLYLDACEEGDLHTSVTQLVWRDLGWTGNKAANKVLAELPFYRHFSYRDMAKRGGHGTNYYGTPWTMARHLKVPKELIENFQRAYFTAFPGHGKWHRWVNSEILRSQRITTYMGRTRTFFGRPGDDATLREAIAYEPQSAVGDTINQGGLQVWQQFCMGPAAPAQILAQIHDAFLFQIPEDRLDLIPLMQKTFEVTVTAPNNRAMTIPSEAMLGWNWAKADPKMKTFSDGNPDGLRKYAGRDERKRTEDPTASMLDRVLL